MDPGNPQIFLDPTALHDAVQRLGIGTYETVIQQLQRTNLPFVSDVYALQQVVYEHHLAGDTAYGYQLNELLQQALTDVFAVTEKELLIAKWLGIEYPSLKSRERLHIATMRAYGVQTLATGTPNRYRHVRHIAIINIRSALESSGVL